MMLDFSPQINLLPEPGCKRFFRNCGDFSLCINIGEKGYLLVEQPINRTTIFYYGLYGCGKFGRIFESNHIILDAEDKKVVDVSEYVHDKVIFEAQTDFYLIGFNTFNKDWKWTATLLTSESKQFQTSSTRAYLVIVSKNIKVNEKLMKRYDYSHLEVDKIYDLDIPENSSAIVFTRSW
jgi:hypothetical protein